MICIVIKGPTIQEAHEQISAASAYADVVELRLDNFQSLDFSALKHLLSSYSIPMIFTLRRPSQGGNYLKSEELLFADFMKLAEIGPAYLDIEYCFPAHYIKNISTKYPEVKIILSYHNFTETPTNLDALYSEMKKVSAYYYKIAVTAQNSSDTLRLLCWKKQIDKNVITISMGTHGQFSRILSPIVGNPFTYATIDNHLTTAPGQLPAKTLIEQYHYRKLTPSTNIYGLIGDPVDLSISDITHNKMIQNHALDAVYVKMRVTESELPEFIHFAKKLPLHGLSVTMPLKEFVLPHIDHIDPIAKEIGACNTLQFHNGTIFGTNTDGMGALNAIERKMPIKGKKIVLIGAGGSAKAIAHEARRRGAHVTVLNRNKKKAEHLANNLSCLGHGLEHLSECHYDILINSTPVGMPIDRNHIRPDSLVMDIKTYPKQSEFLTHASQKGCEIIYGYHMFVEQAVGQFNLWFKNRINVTHLRNSLAETAENHI